MKHKLLLFLTIIFLLSITLASAVGTAPNNNNVNSYYGFDNTTVAANDYTSNSIDGTIQGSTFSASGKILGNYKYDGSNDYIYLNGYNSLGNSNSFSVSFWFNADSIPSSVNSPGLLSNLILDGTYKGFDIRINHQGAGGDINILSDEGVSGAIDTNFAPSTSTWYHVVVRYNYVNTTMEAFINNVKYGSDTSTTFSSNNNLLRLGANTVRNRYFDGAIDELAIFDISLSDDEINYLYQEGTPTSEQQYPFPSVISDINDSTESTAVVKQSGSVSFAGAYTTILSSTFNVTNNNTPLYGGYSFDIESTSLTLAYCELLIDGISRANITRSQEAGVLGNAFIQTETFLIDEGQYTQTLRCRRTAGTGQVTVSNAIGIGHFLINQDNKVIPYNSTTFENVAVSSGSSYTLLKSFNITIGNYTEVDLSQNRTNHIILESKIQYDNSASDEVLSTYMSIDNYNCSKYERFVSTGNSGSVSMDCILQNVTNSTTYQINIYGNGTNAAYTSNTIAKNFFLSEGEIVGGTGIITGYQFTGNSFTEIFSTTGGNLNHALANAFVKLSYSVETDIDTTVSFYINLRDGEEYNTTIWSRDFVAGETGVLIGHDILESLPQDPNYNISLYANCGDAAATCTIKGGSSLGYLTDVTTTILNAFKVKAYDFFDSSNIQNFSVIDGGTWITTNGSVLVFTEQNPENLTINSNGYQTKNILNHNTTLNLNVTLTPTYYFNSVTYDNYINYSGEIYTSDLSYTVSALCPLGETHNAFIVVDGTIFVTDNLVCNNNLVNNVGNFIYSFEGEKEQFINWTGNSEIKGNITINWDLFRPTIVQSFTTGAGFNNNSIDINVLCYDSISPIITYNSSFAGTPLTYSNQTNNTLLSFSDTVQQNNYVYTECTDLGGNTRTNNYTQTVYSSFFYLVDEQNGQLFDINNLTSAIVYLDDNTTSLDLKAAGTNNFSFTSAGEDILRFEYIYSDGFIINRYYSMDLTDSNETRICAIPDKDLQFYEQVIISSIDSKQVSLEASFADCVVIRDRTRFAYQNAFSIRTYVIDTTYKLYNYAAGNVKSILASIDGGIEAFINVDSIEFSSSAFNQGIRAESLNIEKYSDTTMLIYYNNTNNDNTDLDIVITRQDTGAVVYADNELDNNNVLVLFYDFSTLTDLEDNTLFKVVLDATRTDGSDNTLIRFFNTAGSVGQLNPKVAFAIIFTLLLFGLTFPAANDALSWFGMLLCIGNLGLFSFTVMTTGLQVLLAINVIIMIYIGIILTTQTNRQVAT